MSNILSHSYINHIAGVLYNQFIQLHIKLKKINRMQLHTFCIQRIPLHYYCTVFILIILFLFTYQFKFTKNTFITVITLYFLA
jgi:hypothetical protein